MRPTDYAAEYRQQLKEQGVVILPDDDPYRIKYGCVTQADKQKWQLAEYADNADNEVDDNEGH
jgi:hypothetical protein